MSDDRFGSKKSQGLDGTEISRFKEIRHNIQSPFSGPNTPKHHSDLAKPAQDETYYSKVNAGRIVRVQKGDSVTDVMSNLYNLVHKNQLKKREHSEISKNFDKEKVHKEKKKHDEFIGAFGKKDKKLKKLHKKKDESKDSNILFKLAAAVLVLSQYKAAPLLMEKMGGLVEKLSEGMNLAWGAAKDNISKLKPFAPSVLEIVTIPVMNWLHDQLAGMFGEDIIDKFFKKQPEVDIKALGVRMKSALLGEDEITKSTRDLTGSLLPRTSKQSEDALTMGSMKGGKYSPSTIDKALGGSTKKYESGTRGISAVGYDSKGGTSYGSYQIASKTGTMDNFLDYLDSTGKGDVAKELRSAGPSNTGKADGAFADKWKELSASGRLTTEDEHSFIQKTHYDPAQKKAKDLGFNVDNPGVRDAIWSGSVQHGAINKLLSRVASKNPNLKDMSDQDQIKAFYAERSAYAKESGFNLDQRYSQEQQDVLAKSMPEQTTPPSTLLSEKSKENIDMKKQQSTPRSVMFKNDNTTNIMNNTTQQTNTYAAAASTNSPYLSSIGVI